MNNQKYINSCFSKQDLLDNEIMRIPIYVDNKKKILKNASNTFLELSDFFNSPIHPLEEKDWNQVNYFKGSCPNAEIAGKKIVSFSILNGITKNKIQKYSNLFYPKQKNNN